MKLIRSVQRNSTDSGSSNNNNKKSTATMPNATLQRQYQRQLRSKRGAEYGIFSQFLGCLTTTTANKKYHHHRQGGATTTTTTPIAYSVVAWAAGLLVLVVCIGVMMMLWVVRPTQAVGTTTTTVAPPVPLSPALVMEQHSVAATQYSSSSDLLHQHTSRPTASPVISTPRRTKEYKRPDWLDDYLNWSSSIADDDDDVAVLQWTCVGGNCGGLGDRILGIVQTFLIAVCNRRLFVLDGGVPFATRATTQQKQYIPDPLQVVLDNRQDPFWDHLLLNATTTPFLALKTNLWMGQKFFESTCWQNMGVPDDDLSILNSVLREILPWPLETVELGNEWLAQANIRQPQQQFIGVHLRTGHLDGTSHLFDPKAQATLDCARELRAATHCHDDDMMAIYVATDDTHLRRHGLPDDVQTIRDMQVEHYQASSQQHHQQRQRQQATSTSMVELWMLSQADCVVGTPTSKFSYVAGLWAGCYVTADTCHAAAAEQRHLECETTG